MGENVNSFRRNSQASALMSFKKREQAISCIMTWTLKNLELKRLIRYDKMKTKPSPSVGMRAQYMWWLCIGDCACARFPNSLYSNEVTPYFLTITRKAAKESGKQTLRKGIRIQKDSWINRENLPDLTIVTDAFLERKRLQEASVWVFLQEVRATFHVRHPSSRTHKPFPQLNKWGN